MSHLENNTMRILEHYNIEYECQKKFKWSKRYRYDFYLPTLNVVIECQGEQHFTPVDFAGKGEKNAIKELEKNIKRDKIKKDLCNDNNVGIYYINYYDENIEDKIKKIITKYDNENNKLC
jgi:very-short-patch-repair endonuclease